MSITIVGLGPGDPDLLTLNAWRILENAQIVYFRTHRHPVINSLPERVKIESFDHLYESCASFDEVYQRIVECILQLGETQDRIIYAVPGHPLIAETTCSEILRRALQEKIEVEIIDGLSFIEPLCTALEIDPFPNTILVDALELAASHVPLFPPSIPVIIAQLYSRQVASDVKLTLMSLYPDEHPVMLVHGAGNAAQKVINLALYEIDRDEEIGITTSLYLPALKPSSSFEALQEVVAHLRAPDGCPWDKEQTHHSLSSDLLEETYEVINAIDEEDPASMSEEFGDLLLVILLHIQIASELGEFSLPEVLQGINEKIVKRHPHVFGKLQIKDVNGVLQNWERFKAKERAAKGKIDSSALDGVTRTLPALIQAEQFQQRASRVGFEWPDITMVLGKVEEELLEVKDTIGEEQASEIGDLIFAIVNLARWLKVDPESALRTANLRFRKQFTFIEASARELGRQVSELTIDEMLAFWNAAKKT